MNKDTIKITEQPQQQIYQQPVQQKPIAIQFQQPAQPILKSDIINTSIMNKDIIKLTEQEFEAYKLTRWYKVKQGYVDQCVVGVTERGDASQSYEWLVNLIDVDMAILMTKELTDDFINRVTELTENGLNLIVHCTCTGWGGSQIEPNVPTYQQQLNQLLSLINRGFPAERTVLCISPIFPITNGLKRVNAVLSYAFDTLKIPTTRIRISVVDEYIHVKQRYREQGLIPIYGYNNYCKYVNQQQLISITQTLIPWYNKLHIKFELCAEDKLYNTCPEIYELYGCVSLKDLAIFNIKLTDQALSSLRYNKQHRKDCHCLNFKHEILEIEAKEQCPHKCTYCYWHGNDFIDWRN